MNHKKKISTGSNSEWGTFLIHSSLNIKLRPRTLSSFLSIFCVIKTRDLRTKTENHGPDRTRTNQFLNISGRTRTNKFLKISNQLGPIGPRTWRSVDPWLRLYFKSELKIRGSAKWIKKGLSYMTPWSILSDRFCFRYCFRLHLCESGVAQFFYGTQEIFKTFVGPDRTAWSVDSWWHYLLWTTRYPMKSGL